MPDTRPPVRILAVTQLPPPPIGHAFSALCLITGDYEEIEIFHVRMAFSRDMSEVGRPQAGKVAHLFGLIGRVLLSRVRTGAKVLYYPPAGPDLVPVLRDIAFLLATRWAFAVTVFHFHAAGVTEFETRLPRPLRRLFRAAYRAPELAIQTSHLNPPDGRRLGAARVVVVPNGVTEHPLASQPRRPRADPTPVLMYLGVLRESKGLLVLVEACRRLRDRGFDFRLRICGPFASASFAATFRQAVADAGLESRTETLGTVLDDAKAACLATSDVFCYPTFFEAESFGNAIVEAMQFSLPVVATAWRGVPSVVAGDESGLIVAPRDPGAFADALAELLADPERARRMGERGREIYLARFTRDAYRRNMEAVLGDL